MKSKNNRERERERGKKSKNIILIDANIIQSFFSLCLVYTDTINVSISTYHEKIHPNIGTRNLYQIRWIKRSFDKRCIKGNEQRRRFHDDLLPRGKACQSLPPHRRHSHPLVHNIHRENRPHFVASSRKARTRFETIPIATEPKFHFSSLKSALNRIFVERIPLNSISFFLFFFLNRKSKIKN